MTARRNDAVKAVAEKFPQDADLGALYAESLMNLRPWDLWAADGKPQAETPEILRALEAVMKLDAAHPLANHLYIHAVEASPEPGKADAASNALRGKYPALGHLLHMPSHVDIRRGRWQHALDANRLAIQADSWAIISGPPLPEEPPFSCWFSSRHSGLEEVAGCVAPLPWAEPGVVVTKEGW